VAQTPVEFITGQVMGFVFASAANGTVFEAWKGARGVGFRELPNSFYAIFADSGANKTQALNYLRSEFEAAELVFKQASVVTNFTIEGLRGAMADNGGNATVLVDEAKQFFASMLQYAGKGSDAVEKFMELLGGVAQKTVRVNAGGGTSESGTKVADGNSEDGDGSTTSDSAGEEEEPSHSKTIAVSKPHLNVITGTHPHNAVKSYKAEEAMTDGRNARQIISVVRALPVRLPRNRKVLEQLANELAGKAPMFVLFCLVKLYTLTLVQLSGQAVMTLTEEAWDAFWVYYDSCDDDFVALIDALKATQQKSIISKSKGLALKLSGGKMLLLNALRIFDAHKDDLIEWSEGGRDLAALTAIARPTIDAIIAEGETAGGQITLEAVEMGIAETLVHRETSLAIFPNTTVVDESVLGQASGVLSSPSSSEASRVDSPADTQEGAPPPPDFKVPAPKRYPEGGHPQPMLQAGAILLAAKKVRMGVVAASLVSEGKAGVPKLLIGRTTDEAWDPSKAPKKPSVCDGAKLLVSEGLAEKVVEERAASGGGPVRVFVVLKNLVSIVSTSEHREALTKALEVKLGKFLIPNLAAYDDMYRRTFDFASLDEEQATKYMMNADAEAFKAAKRDDAAAAANAAAAITASALAAAPAGADKGDDAPASGEEAAALSTEAAATPQAAQPGGSAMPSLEELESMAEEEEGPTSSDEAEAEAAGHPSKRPRAA